MKVSRGRGTKPALLLVDDEPDLREVLADFLGRAFEVHCACPHTLVDSLTRGRFDVVLLDLTLPGFPFDVVLDLVRRFQADVPVVIMSGHDEVEPVVRNALESGASAFIPKPFPDGDSLAALLLRQLERRAGNSSTGGVAKRSQHTLEK